MRFQGLRQVRDAWAGARKASSVRRPRPEQDHQFSKTSTSWARSPVSLSLRELFQYTELGNYQDGRAVAQAVSRRPTTAEARVRSRGSPCWIWGGQSDTGTGFSSSTSVFPCQFNSTGAPLQGKTKKTIIFITGLHNKPFTKKNTNVDTVNCGQAAECGKHR
jgi:hypothetical protein